MDIISRVGAVVRTVEGREHMGKPARVVIATRTYDTDPDDLWDAITNIERIPRWFLAVSGELRLGGRYQLQGNAGGEITLCEAPRRLEVTWEFGGGVTWLKVALAPASGDRTLLTLEHIAHVGDDLWDQFGPGAVGVGWDLGLHGLALHIETGASVDNRESLAWLTSDEGKRFVGASSDDWCRASIASGTDEAAAKAAAQRTTAAYTAGGDPA